MLNLDEIQKTIKKTEKDMAQAEGRANIKENILENAEYKNVNLTGNSKSETSSYLDKAIFITPVKEVEALKTEKISSSHSSKSSPEIIKKTSIIQGRVKSMELPKKKNKNNDPFSRDNSSSTDSGSLNELSKEESISRSTDSQDSPKNINPRRKSSGSNPKNFFSKDRSFSAKRINSSFKDSSNNEKKELSNSFYETIPINKDLLSDCLKKGRSLLLKNDNKINVFDCEGSPHLKMLLIAPNNQKSNADAASKTVILFDKKNIEGIGAKSQVFKGYDLINQKYWAIKLTNIHTDLRNIEIENLKSRNWLFGCYKLTNEYALIMKFIPGETLIKTLYVTDELVLKDKGNDYYCKSKKDLNVQFKLDLICKLLEQLAKLHKKYKLLHCDLKPENIKIYYKDQQLKVRIIDLGDAVSINSKDKGLRGTKGYLDPRIESAPYDIDADIYSLGVVVAEILTQKNFQQLLSEELRRTAKPISSPNVTFEQLELLMDDVFKIEELHERYENYNDYKINMDNFIIMELKKLARKMLISPLPDLFLENEIASLKSIKEDCPRFSDNIEQLFLLQTNLQNMINSKNRFFLPEFKTNISPVICEATNYFKLTHSPREEHDNGLNI